MSVRATSVRTPKLKRVSLCAAKGHNLPGVTTRKLYLAKVDDEFHLGRFSRQWYGLNFDCPGAGVGIQFDAPGSNNSGWQALWEVRT